MAPRTMVGWACLLSLMVPAAEAQESPPGRAYKLAVWYELANPATSVKTKVYDVAKGEYDEKTVESWLDNIRANYPHHAAYVREIRTDGEPGATEAERLAAALRREADPWPHLRPHRTPKPIPRLIDPARSRGGNASRSSPGCPSPGPSGATSNPAASPIPYPYRSRPL